MNYLFVMKDTNRRLWVLFILVLTFQF